MQGIVKLHGSFNLACNFFYRITLLSSFNITLSWSSNFWLFDKISLKNLAYLGMFSKASIRGILICNSLKILRNLENWLSILLFLSLWGKGTSG